MEEKLGELEANVKMAAADTIGNPTEENTQALQDALNAHKKALYKHDKESPVGDASTRIGKMLNRENFGFTEYDPEYVKEAAIEVLEDMGEKPRKRRDNLVANAVGRAKQEINSPPSPVSQTRPYR